MTSKDLQKVTVGLGDRAYDILVGEGLLSNVHEYLLPCLAQKKVVVITDENVAEAGHLSVLQRGLDQAQVRHQSIIINPGESSKSFSNLEVILNKLLEMKVERSWTIIALGGGVVGDLAGFAASIVLRGVPFIQVPTTLLAMVDSSVGGKTGINTNYGKNLVGAFYQPKRVLIDLEVLQTLSKREWNAGYAEVVKYGVIHDRAFFDALNEGSVSQLGMIVHSCKAKAHIVAEDERESGVRALLNLGHTFGHALEAEMGYDGRLLHGEAVAAGMVMALEFSARQGLCPQKDVSLLVNHLKTKGLVTGPKDIAPHWNVERLVEHMKSDKKVRDGNMVFILAKGVGQAYIDDRVAEEEIKKYLLKSVS